MDLLHYENLAGVLAGDAEGSILRPILSLIYINDLSKELKSNAKLFADDRSLFYYC